MKKIIAALALICILIFSFAGCSSSSFLFQPSLPIPKNPKIFAINNHYEVLTENLISTPNNTTIFDLFNIENDFLLTTWGNNKPSPIYFIRSLGNDQFRNESSFVFEKTPLAIHPRHAIAFDFNNDNINDFVIADHGMDLPPYPGGLPLLLLSHKNKWRLAEANKLSNEQIFNYHVSAMKFKDKKYLYLSNLNSSESSRPILWEIDARGNFQLKNEFLPEDLRNGKNCYMSSEMSDLDEDGVAELILGACDRQIGEIPRDAIFKFDETKGFIQLPTDSLPLRQKNISWGTAHFVIADFNQDGKKDILALPHNEGFSESVIQIYYQTNPLQFVSSKTPFPYISPPNSFVIWAAVGDINGDGYPDIAFNIRFKNSEDIKSNITYRLYLNDKGKKFVDVTPTLPLDHLIFVGMHFLPAKKGEPQTLFAMDYVGNYYLIKKLLNAP